MAHDYVLKLQTPVKDGAPVYVMDLTGWAEGWRRSTRSRGGYWQGDFTLAGDVDELAAFFYEFLGYHVAETSGGSPTWEGMVYEMELTVGGASRRRSLDTMANSITTLYSYDDGTGKQVKSTSSSADTNSIARYGQREELRIVSGQPTAAAESARDSYLKEFAFPWARPVGVSSRGREPSLRVTVCGYVFTINWQFISRPETPAAEDDLSTWVSEIIVNSCPFLTAGSITPNAIQVVKMNEMEYLRSWDTIDKLVDLGIGSPPVPARAWVYGGRKFNYGIVDNAVQYYWRGGELRSSAGSSTSVNPWAVRPGVVRDMDYPVRKKETGAWLADVRDMYMEEVEMGDGFDQPVLKAALFDESEIIVAQEANRVLLAEQAKRAKKVRKRGKG